MITSIIAQLFTLLVQDIVGYFTLLELKRVRARQIKSISKQVGGKVEGTKKAICSQMDLPYNFYSLVAALSKVLDFRGCLRP